MRLGALVLFAATATAITVATVEGQGKNKSPASRPATGVFRCAVTDAADCPGVTVSIVPDGVRSDGLGAYAPPPGADTSASGTWLDGLGEFSLHLSAGSGRSVFLDFRNPIVAPSCGTACKKHFDTLTLQALWIHTNVVDAAGDEVDGGLTTIPIGGSTAARLKIVFDTINQAGETIPWAVRFNPEGYPGSDHVTVTRLAASSWVVEATPLNRARLVSPGSRGRGPLDEGTYSMPFRVTMTIP